MRVASLVLMQRRTARLERRARQRRERRVIPRRIVAAPSRAQSPPSVSEKSKTHKRLSSSARTRRCMIAFSSSTIRFGFLETRSTRSANGRLSFFKCQTLSPSSDASSEWKRRQLHSRNTRGDVRLRRNQSREREPDDKRAADHRRKVADKETDFLQRLSCGPQPLDTATLTGAPTPRVFPVGKP